MSLLTRKRSWRDKLKSVFGGSAGSGAAASPAAAPGGPACAPPPAPPLLDVSAGSHASAWSLASAGSATDDGTLTPTTDADAEGTGTLSRRGARKDEQRWQLRGTRRASGPDPPPPVPPDAAAKCYGLLVPQELALLQAHAVARLNWLLANAGPRAARRSIRAPGDRDGDVKRWWSTLVRKKAADTVTGAPIQKSVAYASVTLGNSVSPDFRVPIIVYECCRFIREAGLRTEGIFRISGSERRIATKYPEFDTPPTYGLHTSWDGYTVHDVATILKKYLRDVPEPLFTNELFPYFLQTLDVSPDDAVRANYVQCLVCLLSPAHLVVVEFLFELLVDIARNADRTQMTTSNLARVLAPTVLRQGSGREGGPGSSSGDLAGAGLNELEAAAEVVEFMLESYPRWGRLTAPRSRPFLMIAGDSPASPVEWDRGHPAGHDDAAADRMSLDSFRRGDDSSPTYSGRRSFSFASTGQDSLQLFPPYLLSPGSDGSSRTAAVPWRSPTAGSLPPVNLTLTVDGQGDNDSPVTVPVAPPTPSSQGDEAAPVWPADNAASDVFDGRISPGPAGVRRSRTAPVKRSRTRDASDPPSPPSPTAAHRGSTVSAQIPAPSSRPFDSLRRSVSNAVETLGRASRRRERAEGAASEERIRALEAEVAKLSAQIERVSMRHGELERRFGVPGR